ncbi:hypothetical protein POJ06DRAFT_285973 [Lipomyces tetrasporus]|uniref:DUF7881 domain-containing protein n=1 Tax=Lipomyces tetrasporus TaxID=54092 RepID=A0AAD7QLE4_9ASCO|nr:uncharacterized protein POJ06DRAFT_285973 [Lipomyces tetrasporus]KAJ8097289.1 hypothetical protein POJ06DRAFT_285973 [Lipomyces tetrasporus]
MAPNRSLGRDVHFYDISNPDDALGGLQLTPSFTERTFYFALRILVISASPYDVYLRGTDVPLTPTDDPLQPGKYDIKPTSPHGRIFITNEGCITRVLSHTVSGRDEKFRRAVRERDGKCVITGVVNPQRRVDLDNWSSYHAAHIFPLSGEEWFVANSFSRLTTLISVNPDDDYRIVTFADDLFNVGGRQLDPVCRDPDSERSATAELLRWHFRQAVLANMRGAGEPIFEADFPAGTDIVGEILSGPQASQRMEAELSSRLNGLSVP